MGSIISLTDFSQAGNNAVRYSSELATRLGTEIIVMHSVVIPIMFSDIPIPGTFIIDAENEAQAHMNSLVELLAGDFPGVKIEGKVAVGSTLDTVNEYLETVGSPFLIVVGNSSKSDSRIWPESILLDEVSKLKFPVLAIPEDYTWKSASKLCFAYDSLHIYSPQEVGRINSIAKSLNGNLHVVNVQAEEIDTQAIEALSNDICNNLSVPKEMVHVITGSKNIDNSILDAIEKINSDWLIMVPGKHSFFEGLFHKSHTNKILHSCPIPILAIHD
jgi:nucleotide-binding universal stress UspA family protein